MPLSDQRNIAYYPFLDHLRSIALKKDLSHTMDEADGILFLSLRQHGIRFDSSVSSLGEFTARTFIRPVVQALLECVKKHDLEEEWKAAISNCDLDNLAHRPRLCQALVKLSMALGYTGECDFHLFCYPTPRVVRPYLIWLMDQINEDNPSCESPLGSMPSFCPFRFSFRQNISYLTGNSTMPVHTNVLQARERKCPPEVTEQEWLEYQQIYAPYLADHGQQGAKIHIPATLISRHANTMNQNLYENTPPIFPPRKTSAKSVPSPCNVDPVKSVLLPTSVVDPVTTSFNPETTPFNPALDHESMKDLVAQVQHQQQARDQLNRELEQLKTTTVDLERAFRRKKKWKHSTNSDIQRQEQALEKLEEDWEVYKRPFVEQLGTLTQKHEEAKAQSEHSFGKMQHLRTDVIPTLERELSLAQQREQHVLHTVETLLGEPRDDRNVYVTRLLDLTRQIQKQKDELHKIRQEIHGIQKQMNATAGTLKRCEVVVEEQLYQTAKGNDRQSLFPTPASTFTKQSIQAYESVSTLRQCFDQVIERIEEAGKLEHATRDLETKMSVISSRISAQHVEQIQHDLDQMHRENQALEQQLVLP